MHTSLPLSKLQLVTLLLVLFASAFSLAQVTKGSISGNVADPTGAVVVGAEVRASNAATGQVATTTSDNSGLFKLPLLAVGAYRVQVSKAGFKAASVASVQVTPGVDAGLGTLKLEIGAATETVEVLAGTPLVETTQAQVTDTFSATELNSLPGIGGNEGLDNMAILLPGVSMARDVGFSNSNGVDFSVNGLRARDNDQQVDGQNNNDNSVGGPGIFVSDTNFVDEYQVVTNNFGAEYGRNAGSVVNITTKSGTNTWHGSVYGSESNSALTSLTNLQKEFEGLTKPSRFNDEFTGATIGGPWKKDKIFFFGGFDNEIISSSTVEADSGVTPTPLGVSQLAGCFPGSTSVAALQAYGPFAIGGGNPVVSPGSASVTDFGSANPINGADPSLVVPVPNDGATGCNVELGNVQRLLGNGSHQYNWVSRLDINGNGGKDIVYVRYLFQKQVFFNADEGNGGAGYPVNVPSLGQDLGMSWTHKISNNMLNEFRASQGRQNVQFGGNTLGTVPTDPGLLGALATITFADPNSNLGFGPTDSEFPQGRIVNTTQIQDNWSYVRGKHQFKAGLNYTFQKSPNVFLPNLNGSFEFADWGYYAANVPVQTNIDLGTPKLDFLEHDSFFYFADDWKVSQRLTLNLGLTYSYYGQPADLFNRNDVRQQTSNEPFWNPSLPSSVTEFPNLPAPKNSWGPSIGFAYAVGHGGWLLGDDKTVFRGGYRRSYDPPFYNIYLNIASSSPQVLAQTIPGLAQGTPQPAALPAVPTGTNVRSELSPFLTLGVSDPRDFNQTSVVPNFRPDHVDSWSFGIQRELGAHAAFEARYVGNRGRNLFQSVNGNPYVGCPSGEDAANDGCFNAAHTADIPGLLPGLADGIADGVFNANLLPPGLTPCSAANAAVASAIGRENCNEGVDRSRTNTAYSAYNGLQLEFRTTNLLKQLTMKANYTWSKTTDNASEIFGTFGAGGTVAFSQDPFNYTKPEHGLSGLDFPQTMQISFNEAIPVYRSQHGFAGHAFGGWSIAGSYILQSGQPYTPTELIYDFSRFGLNPYNVSDQNVLGAFNAGFDTTRPFISNRSAPASAIGIYAADACNIFGAACSAPATALYDFTAMNGSNGAVVTPVTASQERFILNGIEAQTVNGTPYGNAARNSLRDFHTNVANLDFSKTSNIGERVRFIWDMQMQNVFNHAQYNSIDPFLEDAGAVGFETGFANPYVFNSAYQNGASNRLIKFRVRVTF
ncbi:MAG: TonB-dependent receptor [Terriglobales bacterium]